MLQDAVTKKYPIPSGVLSGTLFTALDAANLYHPHTTRIIEERVVPFYLYYLGDKSFSQVPFFYIFIFYIFAFIRLLFLLLCFIINFSTTGRESYQN